MSVVHKAEVIDSLKNGTEKVLELPFNLFIREHTVKILLAFFALYIVWGSTYVAIRFALQSFPLFMMAGTRFLTAGSILLVWALAKGAKKPDFSHWLHSAIIGVMLLVIANAGVAFALKTVPTGLVALLSAMVPIFVVILDWLRPNGIAPSKRIMLGLVVGIIGTLILIGPEKILQGKGIDFIGVAAVFLASLSWSAGSLYSRYAKHKLPESPMLATSMQMLSAGIVLMSIAICSGEFAHFNTASVSVNSLIALAYLITFGSLIAFSAYVWLLQVVSPSRVSTYAYVNPVVAVILGWLFLGESITNQTVVAAAIILMSVWFINDAKHAKKVADLASARQQKLLTTKPAATRLSWSDKELCAEKG